MVSLCNIASSSSKCHRLPAAVVDCILIDDYDDTGLLRSLTFNFSHRITSQQNLKLRRDAVSRHFRGHLRDEPGHHQSAPEHNVSNSGEFARGFTAHTHAHTHTHMHSFTHFLSDGGRLHIRNQQSQQHRKCVHPVASANTDHQRADIHVHATQHRKRLCLGGVLEHASAGMISYDDFISACMLSLLVTLVVFHPSHCVLYSSIISLDDNIVGIQVMAAISGL